MLDSHQVLNSHQLRSRSARRQREQTSKMETSVPPAGATAECHKHSGPSGPNKPERFRQHVGGHTRSKRAKKMPSRRKKAPCASLTAANSSCLVSTTTTTTTAATPQDVQCPNRSAVMKRTFDSDASGPGYVHDDKCSATEAAPQSFTSNNPPLAKNAAWVLQPARTDEGEKIDVLDYHGTMRHSGPPRSSAASQGSEGEETTAEQGAVASWKTRQKSPVHVLVNFTLMMVCTFWSGASSPHTRQVVRTGTRLVGCIFAPEDDALMSDVHGACVMWPSLCVHKGSIMVHMEGFDHTQPSHVETMRRAMERLAVRFPRGGFVLQLGDRFYRYVDGGLQEVPWDGSTPPPVATRMSAVDLPRHGRCVLVEGQHLHIPLAPTSAATAPSRDRQTAQQVMAAEGGGLATAVMDAPEPPLVLYCIQTEVVQAEKLRPMYSTPDGCKALFAAPRGLLPDVGTVTLRLRRGHAFSPDVRMNAGWLRPLSSTVHQVIADVTNQMGSVQLA